MPLLTEPAREPRAQFASWLAVALSIVAVVLVLAGLVHGAATPPNQVQARGTLQTIAKSGVLRVGYGGFPPYTIIDPKESDPNKQVKGFSVDLVNEIAKRQVPPLRVEWHRFSWDTLKADMQSGKFDFVADPVFQTVPRAVEFGLCDPYSYFGIAVAVVRTDDQRFTTFKDLDRPGVVIALAAGWTSTEFAQKNLAKPTFKLISVTGDAFNQLDEVLLGRADVALNDVPTVAQYVRAHPGKVKALWLDNPPSSVAGGFMTRRADVDLRDFLNASLRVVQADGVLNRLDEKWKAYGFIPHVAVTPGTGLAQRAAGSLSP